MEYSIYMLGNIQMQIQYLEVSISQNMKKLIKNFQESLHIPIAIAV